MKQYKLFNNIFGWIAFVVAAITYLLTIEPTASFWDCGEFISAAYKLDVGHPPGAPFFMLTARICTLFASDPSQVAVMVNSFSAILSALTILFLFWTITHIAHKVVIKSESDYTPGNIIGILGAGMVGALVYTFSDSFWFSAVEGEVYAYSSFFTAIVVWLMMKWERVADRPRSDRWLILIAYLMGVSIGVHLLNLLCIPALVLMYYYKKYQPTIKGTLLALGLSMVILVAVLYGIIPGFVQVACWFELLFVNTMGFGFNSGLFAYIILLVATSGWAIYESYVNKNTIRMIISFILLISLSGIPFLGEHVVLGAIIILGMIAFFYWKKDMVSARWLNTISLMVTVILIGYSSYAATVIRSAAKPTMDQNAPDNVFSLKYYLNREQYGDRPLFYGACYSAPVKLRIEGNNCIPETTEGSAMYAKKPKNSPSDKDEYAFIGKKIDYVMNDKFNMFFPRMYSTSPQHINAYKEWGKVEGETIDFDYCGQQRSEVKPTFIENMRFFFEYQVGFMYWRYFMWNFAGRQNDMQGYGENDHGNWISGISFIDNMMLGDQSKMPTELKENKGHNVYFFLPLLLGILGMIYLIYGGKKGMEGFWITSLLFFLTGLAIVIYLNQTPYQPRERDYAYSGSFYAFSIWIGFGVLAIIQGIKKWMPKTAGAVLVTLCCLGVPALMAQQNWDDHDRSNRYTCRDFGNNYLSSCKPNAIIFSNGDNDTFPLWYNQEVEGNGTDIRVCNLSYLQTDWYINQMKRGAYKSAPLPISWKAKDVLGSKNDVVWVDSLMPEIDIKTAFDKCILSDDPSFKKDGESFLPSNHLFLPVDAQQVIKNGAMPASRIGEIVPRLDVKVNRRLTKSELMILELLKENNWKRPVYFAVTVGDDYYLGLDKHFEMTGMAYQILPVDKTQANAGGVNVDEMYTNMMTKFKYGNINDPKVYIDENIMRMCRTHRMMFASLISALVEKGDLVRARKALDYCDKMIPGTTVRHDIISTQLAEAYYKLGDTKKANQIMDVVASDCCENLDWFFGQGSAAFNSVSNRISQNMGILNQVLRICDGAKQQSILNKYSPRFTDYYNRLKM